MFSRKKKDKTAVENGAKTSTPVTTTADQLASAVPVFTDTQASQPPPPLTVDELNRLETTRARLFGAKTKQKAPDIPTKNSMLAHPVNAPPPRPPKPVHVQQHQNGHPTQLDSAPDYAPPLPPHQSTSTTTTGLSLYHNMMLSSPSPVSSGRVSHASESIDDTETLGFGYRPLRAMPGLQLPSLEPVSDVERTVRLERGANGRFEFALRRANIDDDTIGGGSRSVMFVEPTNVDSLDAGMPTVSQVGF
jgi:hypothetical protein